MTKKDYIIIAEAIKPVIDTTTDGVAWINLKAFLHNFCISAKANNIKFDVEKFKEFVLK